MTSDTRARPGLIVLPLDGSSLSEGALPCAEAFARAIGASLLLITVWEGIDTSLSRERELFERVSSKEEHDHREYLSRVAQRLERSGLHVETDFLIGKPADEILRVVGEREPRLLVLATHGRSGLSRWRYGSVAGRLVREAPVPTAVVGPNVLVRRNSCVRFDESSCRWMDRLSLSRPCQSLESSQPRLTRTWCWPEWSTL